MSTFLWFLFLAGGVFGAGAFSVKTLIYVCHPSEVRIFAGLRKKLSDGRTVGYRKVQGGRALRKPLIEKNLST